MRLLSLVTIIVVFIGSFGYSVSAQGNAAPQQSQVEKVKAKVKKIGIGERGKIKANLLDGTSYEGFVREANEDNFVIVDKQGSPHVVRFVDVKEVKSRKGLSTGAKIGIG